MPDAPTELQPTDDQDQADGQPTPPVRVAIEPEVPTPPSLQELESFVRATGGTVPYPRTPAAFAALDRTTRALVEQALPAMAQRLGANVETLPAELELRMAQGDQTYSAEELAALARAGYHGTVAEAKAARLSALEAGWSEGLARRRAEREAGREAAEERGRLERARLEAAVAAAARAQHLGLR